jgi:acetate---CoA ligase (ADP-forming)
VKLLFYPESAVIIGVSARPGNLGMEIARNMLEFGYTGLVYFVGPKGGTFAGHRIHKSLDEISDHIDLAVILTPAATVPGIMEECGRKGIPRVIIETGGFGEFGEEGRRLSDQLKSIAERYSMRFIGPNCVGIMNSANGLTTPFIPMKNVFRSGTIGIIAQSGGVVISFLSMFQGGQMGHSKFATIGNKLNIDENDMLEYYIEDPDTQVICLYLESINDGRRLAEIARRSKKPIVVHKANISSLSRVIAQSHTDALINDDDVVDAAFNQVGIIRTREMHSYLDLAKLYQLPRLKGRNLAIVSRSGGHAVMAADAAYLGGFNLPPFSENFINEIRGHLRADVIRLGNPLDLGDLFDFDFYLRIIEHTLQQENIDGILFMHTYTSVTEGPTSLRLLESIAALSIKYSKPVVVCVSTKQSELANLHEQFPFPIFPSPDRAVNAMDIAIRRRERRLFLTENTTIITPEPAPEDENIRGLLAAGLRESHSLGLDKALQLVRALGICVPDFSVVPDAAHVDAALQNILGPYVLKIIADGVSHKSDLGGVLLGILDQGSVSRAAREMMERFQSIPNAGVRGLLVQQMIRRAPGDVELIVGGKRDPQFGPVVLVGHGGVLVEVLKKTSLRMAPLTPAEADEMITGLPGHEILDGVRGMPALDKEALRDAILRVAHLMVNFPEIDSIDINPLLLTSTSALALDSRVFLKR